MTQFFLQQWRTPGQSNDLLHAAVLWCQANVGFGTSFLTDVETKAPHFESKFLKTIRDFLKHAKGRIELDWDHAPKTQCKNDQHLMDMMVQQSFTDAETTQMNCARVHLKMMTTADMATVNRKKLDHRLCNGHDGPWTSEIKMPFIRQDKPGTKAWEVWRKALRMTSNKKGKLFVKLGAWTQPEKDLRRRWPTCHSHTTKSTHFANRMTIAKHMHAHINFFDKTGTPTDKMPEHSLPAEVNETMMSWKLK